MTQRLIATLPGLIWPGLGKLYNRQAIKGLLLCLVQPALVTLFVIFRSRPLSVVTVVMVPLAVWAGCDAHRVAAVRAFYRAFE